MHALQAGHEILARGGRRLASWHGTLILSTDTRQEYTLLLKNQTRSLCVATSSISSQLYLLSLVRVLLVDGVETNWPRNRGFIYFSSWRRVP